MITKEQFEAIVRAEAWDRYPVQGWTDPRDAELFDSLNRDQENLQEAYIATRMEHEWKLVEALQRIEHGYSTQGKERWSLVEVIQEHYRHARQALSPYTAKP